MAMRDSEEGASPNCTRHLRIFHRKGLCFYVGIFVLKRVSANDNAFVIQFQSHTTRAGITAEDPYTLTTIF